MTQDFLQQREVDFLEIDEKLEIVEFVSRFVLTKRLQKAVLFSKH